MKYSLPKLVQEFQMPREEFHFIKIIHEIVALSKRYGNEDAVDAICYIITVAKDEKIKFYAVNEIHKIKKR